MADSPSPSHEWRKLYGQRLSTSEKLSLVSYEARWLYVLVLGLQDDHGAYPWTPIMVRSLVLTTDWSFTTATKYRDELIRHNLGRLDDERITMFVIHNGEKLNGVTKSGGNPGIARLYPGTTQVVPKGYPGSTQVALDETRRDETIRPEEKRLEAPPHKNKKPLVLDHLPINDEFLAQMQEAYPALNVPEEFARAQNRKQWGDYLDKRRAFQDWLKRSLTYLAAPPSVPRPQVNGSAPPPNKYDVERERIRVLGVAGHANP